MFIVYNTSTTVEQAAGKRYKSYATAAKRAAKLSTANYRYAAVHEDFYNAYIVHYRLVRNVLSGVKFWELSNTPYYLSPSSETYHSA